jgi:hypothetical protein
MPRNFIAGLCVGTNFPHIKVEEDKAFFINVDKCNDIIIVDRKYFLENIGLIYSWALSFEKKAEVIEKLI